MNSIYKLILSIAVPLAVGGISGFFTASSVNTWFKTLIKPSFNPPSWLFAPVWTILYILMGVSFYIVWNSHAKLEKRTTGYTYYWLQLMLNFAWSFLFFFYRRSDLALIDIIVLFMMIASTIFSFRKVSKIAAWLLVPYLCWVAFATALNFEIWRLN
ncbi:MAG: TspO/MBR family protein [Ferruginibacter sp.]